MNTATDTLMPAQHHPDPDPTDIDETPREGVKAVALFESRSGRDRRAWDELSEIDRAVLLEAVRLRRQAKSQRARLHAELYRMRINR